MTIARRFDFWWALNAVLVGLSACRPPLTDAERPSPSLSRTGPSTTDTKPGSSEARENRYVKLRDDGISYEGAWSVRVSRRCLQPYLGLGLDGPLTDRYVPVQESNRVVGLKALIRSDGVLYALGVRPGDTIVSMAGVRVDSPENCLKAAEHLRGEETDSFALEVLREGKSRKLLILLEDSPSTCELFRRSPWL